MGVFYAVIVYWDHDPGVPSFFTGGYDPSQLPFYRKLVAGFIAPRPGELQGRAELATFLGINAKRVREAVEVAGHASLYGSEEEDQALTDLLQEILPKGI